MNLIYQYYLPYTGNNKDIIKVGSNGVPDWVDLSLVSVKKYAKCINVEYQYSDKVIINAPNQNLESARIFLDPYFDQYDNVLLLDVDMLVNTNDDIFDIEVEDIGMVPESPGAPMAFITDILNKVERYGNIEIPYSKNYPTMKRYLNGGLQLWSKEGRMKARERFGGLKEIQRYRNTLRLNEQPYINLMITKHNLRVTEISSSWNKLPYMWKNNTPDGKINHFLATHKRRMKDYAVTNK